MTTHLSSSWCIIGLAIYIVKQRMRRASEISNAILSFPELSTNGHLQQQLELIINNIVKDYVLSWYYLISTYPVFPRLIGETLSQSFINISAIYTKLNISDIIFTDVLLLFKQHLITYHTAKEHYSSFPSHSLDSYFHSIKPHPAIDNEQSYIREYAKRITNHCLNDNDKNSQTVQLLVVDIISFILESVIETISQPDMVYTMVESLLINNSDSNLSFISPNIIKMMKNILKPETPDYYNDLMDIFDTIFKLKEISDIPNQYQFVWTIYYTLLEPILVGISGQYFDDLLRDIINKTLEPELMAHFISYLNHLLFVKQDPKPFVMDEEYEFVPYGKQRRQLATLITSKLPFLFVTGLGGSSRVNVMLDGNLLAVFASKVRNKHFIYGLMDILMHFVFVVKAKRTKSIKYVSSQLKIPEMKTHRQSYSTSIGQSYKSELFGKSQK